MESLHITGAARADGEVDATGRIDIDEFVTRRRARYGLGCLPGLMPHPF